MKFICLKERKDKQIRVYSTKNGKTARCDYHGDLKEEAKKIIENMVRKGYKEIKE